ncbi:MAG: hypothetical protein COA44_15745, partial [Arcobacter sp.]
MSKQVNAVRKEDVSLKLKKILVRARRQVFSELIGPGLPMYTPKGTAILQKIKDYSRELRKEIGYQEVQSPQI